MVDAGSEIAGAASVESVWGEPDPFGEVVQAFLVPNPSAQCPPELCGHAGPGQAKPLLKPQKESGWYIGETYSFNLLNVEFYDLASKELHFSGQRQDIRNAWNGLAELLARSKALGFVEINSKFINMRNLSSIHVLQGEGGASLTFRDGATLRISFADYNRLIDVAK